MNIFGKLFKGDKTIWCIFIALCVISLLEVFSATSTIVYRQQNAFGPILRHTGFLVTGFFIVMFLQRVQTRFFSILILVLPLSCALLAVTMLIGHSVNGAQRYIGVGFISLQPSELAKIAAVGFVAFFLSRMNASNEKSIFKTIMVGIGLTCALIMPENLSTALLLFSVCFIMMFIGQVKIKRLAMIVLICGGGAVVIVGSLKVVPPDVVKHYFPNRFATWQSRFEKHNNAPAVDTAGNVLEYKMTDESRQVDHSKIAIARGGIIGLPGSGVERDFLPQAYSDFIFSIILEEMGLLGGLFVMMLYVALMIRAGMLARKCEKLFPKYLILGSALMLTIQALANMSVAVNLIPVTGQPLPLISRGGTSTIITCVYFGIILACSNIKENQHEDVDESIANVDYGESSLSEEESSLDKNI